MTLCNEYLQVKICGQRCLQCVSLCYTETSIIRFLIFFLFIFFLFLNFVLYGEAQGQKAEAKDREKNRIKIHEIKDRIIF